MLGVFSLGLLSAALPPAASGARPAGGSEAAGLDESVNPRIEAGDVVSIIIYPADEYSREVTVGGDGTVELALIGSLVVKDLTTKELEKLLESKYSKYVDHPKVSVATRHFASRKLAILGEVHQPGFYQYRDGMKVLELVSLAGGLGEAARTTRITILRPGSTQAMRFNFQAVIDGHLDRDLILLPGDTVYVPKAPWTKRTGWVNANVLPWLSLASLVATLVILFRQQ